MMMMYCVVSIVNDLGTKISSLVVLFKDLAILYCNLCYVIDKQSREVTFHHF